ncbi:MAG: Hsp20/alpha crystallin family protein [Phycisphaerales bacterium]|nr:Hsp20/alpha crystallin family protein [Phycisphaerales bacterium]
MTQQTITTPETTINRVRDGFGVLFDSMLPTFARSLGLQSGSPAMNMIEDDLNIYLEAELPGILLEDIELSVTDEVLTIAGSRTIVADDDASPIRQERMDYDFERSITIPVNVEIERAEAEIRNGVLTITLPKAEASRTRRIAVARG